MIHQILSLADVKCIYKYVRTIHELKYFIEDFHKSQYRYLHISCHGSEDDPTECFVVWLVMTRRNVATAIDVMKRFILNYPSLKKKLQEIYAFHDVD